MSAVDEKHVVIWTACTERKADGTFCGKPAKRVVPAWSRGSYWPALCESCEQERAELESRDPICMQVAERGIGNVDWERHDD